MCNRIILNSALLLAAFISILFIISCEQVEKSAPSPLESHPLEITGSPDRAIWSITIDGTIDIYEFPSGNRIYSGPEDEVLTSWDTGMLTRRDGEFQWWDLDLDTGEYNPVDELDLTSWHTPVAVDPQERIIYTFEHTVPPTRTIKAHYLDGRVPERTAEIVAEEIETLDPLPANGWPIFYVDRPSQAGAVTPEDEPTRKLRIYSGDNIGGEFPNVTYIQTLGDDVAIHSDDTGWMLLEEKLGIVERRTMSLGQIPGNPRPLARDGNVILVASEQPSADGETEGGSALYRYEAYIRSVSEMPGPSKPDEPGKILSISVREPDEYYAVVGILPEMRTLALFRYIDEKWVEDARITLEDEPDSTRILFLRSPELPFSESPGDPIGGSGGNADDNPDGDSGGEDREEPGSVSLISSE